MVDAIPWPPLKFNINFITLLKFLDRFETFSVTHDTPVSEWNLEAGHAAVNQDLKVLASVPVVIGGVDDPSH